MNKFNNIVLLVGQVSSIEMNETKNGILYSTFSILTKETFFTKTGEKHTHHQHHACIAYNKTAEFIRDHVRNNQQIALEGRLIQMPTTKLLKPQAEVMVNVCEVINLH